MKTLLAILILAYLPTSFAADISVIDVRRNITLAENDTVYKDFYINTNAHTGFKKNLVVTAVRKINIRDASGANSFGAINVPVGQLKIIAIFDQVAVAREYKLLSRDELPMLEQTGIMVGDQIDFQGSFVDKSKPKPKARASLTEPSSPTLPAIAAVVEKVLQTSTTTSTPSTAPAEKLEKVADSGN